jgi:hypothetical protein
LQTGKADQLREALASSGKDLGVVNFQVILEKLIAAMPRMTLGTMDSFFTKVVKAFPLELGITAKSFQLIEGAEAEIVREQLLQSLLQEELSEAEAEKFFQAFRKSLMGQEKIGVLSQIDDYTGRWHRHWRGGGERLAWGPDALAEGGGIARISSLQNTGASSCVGVMIRDSLATNSKQIFMGMSSSNAYRWVRRTATGGSTTVSNSSTGTVPNTWVRLVRSGTTITAYKSTNGTSWTTVGSTTKTTFASTCYIGLAVGSGSDTTLNTSQFSNLSVTP